MEEMSSFSVEEKMGKPLVELSSGSSDSRHCGISAEKGGIRGCGLLTHSLMDANDTSSFFSRFRTLTKSR